MRCQHKGGSRGLSRPVPGKGGGGLCLICQHEGGSRGLTPSLQGQAGGNGRKAAGRGGGPQQRADGEGRPGAPTQGRQRAVRPHRQGAGEEGQSLSGSRDMRAAGWGAAAAASSAALLQIAAGNVGRVRSYSRGIRGRSQPQDVIAPDASDEQRHAVIADHVLLLP